MEVTTRVIKLNPYGEVHTGVVILPLRGSEETVIRFTISPTGYVKSKNRRQKRFAGKRQPGGIMTSAGSTPMQPPPTGEGEQIGTRRPPDYEEPADDDEVHGAAGFDDELHEQTGTSFVGGREDADGFSQDPDSYSNRDIGDTPMPAPAPADPNSKEEEERVGGF